MPTFRAPWIRLVGWLSRSRNNHSHPTQIIGARSGSNHCCQQWPPIWAETESDMPALSFYIATALCAGGIVATMALPPLETIEAKASAAAMKAGDHGGRYDTIDSPTIRYRRSDGPGASSYRKPLLADERARYQ